MRPGASRRLAVVVLAAVVALLLQVTVLPPFALRAGGFDVVPDLVLLVVVATALFVDARTGLLVGFGAGLLLDLAPPADHLAGRWALALVAVAYVVGRLAHDDAGVSSRAGATAPGEGSRRVPLPVLLAALAGGSFVGTSVFALTGLLLDDTGASVGGLLVAVGVAVVQDLVAGLVVVPLLARLLVPGAPRRRPRSRGDEAALRPRSQDDERSWMRVG
ncbi:rod shape-determining protein MreD [Nocardioides sp.]|uniref:rod shape-determining protein MreD n=1 Tax=Nocardioides sp. TaxID=35761 RepID=UPI003519A287